MQSVYLPAWDNELYRQRKITTGVYGHFIMNYMALMYDRMVELKKTQKTHFMEAISNVKLHYKIIFLKSPANSDSNFLN